MVVGIRIGFQFSQGETQGIGADATLAAHRIFDEFCGISETLIAPIYQWRHGLLGAHRVRRRSTLPGTGQATEKGRKMSLYLIAEIGINHNGDPEIAKKLIDAAANAGFDAVKFQKRTVEEIYSKEFLGGPRESPWGTTQRHQKMGLEFGEVEYRAIDAYCRQLGIAWSASAWDVGSQLFLRDFDLAFNKIASPMLGHRPVLRAVAEEGRKTFISTGMSTLEEIDEVVEIFLRANCPFELMHCNSSYPMDDHNANLLCIPMLRSRYNCEVGYSGHESSQVKICSAAVALGATSIERHITLDRAMYGSDQAASIGAPSLVGFVKGLRAVELALGDGEKFVRDEEVEAREKLRRVVPDQLGAAAA